MGQPKTFTGHRVGEYQIVRRIGVGGMGIVYEGVHPLIGKRVAVKVLRSSLSSDQRFVERFVSEARAVNAIRHRGIVDIFAMGQLDDGAHYFVMELLEGQPFDRILKERAPLPVLEVLSFAEQICAALHAAHQAHVIHRDLKPSNLFLVDSGREPPYVKLLDFGIAKLGGEGASQQTQTGVAVGTPDYMSPEQARGGTVTAQSDIYALGCLLFELLTGRHVFIGQNDVEVILKHVQEEPPHLTELRPDVPTQVDQLVWWMLRKDPAERPVSCELLGRACASLRQRFEPGAAPPRPSAPSLIPPQPTPPGRSLHTPAPVTVTKPATSEHAVPQEHATGPRPVAPGRGSPVGAIAFTLLALGGAGAYGYWRYFMPAPVVETAAPPPPAPVVVTPPPAVEAPPAVAAPSPPPVVKKQPPLKRVRKQVAPGTIVTREQLFARIFALEKRLGHTGDTDGQLLQRLTEARTAAKQATTNDQRLDVAASLDELDVLLAP